MGEVNSPGFYQFIKGGRINDILNEAGGLTQKAEKANIYILFPNGKSYKYSRFLKNRKVIDGSVITVGREEDREPFNVNQYLTELTTILASIAQTYVLVMVATGVHSILCFFKKIIPDSFSKIIKAEQFESLFLTQH